MDTLLIILILIGIFYIFGTVIDGIIYKNDNNRSLPDKKMELYMFNKDLINCTKNATEPLIRYYEDSGLIFMIDNKTGNLFCIRKALTNNQLKQKSTQYIKSSEEIAKNIKPNEYIQNNKPIMINYIQKAEENPYINIIDLLTWEL